VREKVWPAPAPLRRDGSASTRRWSRSTRTRSGQPAHVGPVNLIWDPVRAVNLIWDSYQAGCVSRHWRYLSGDVSPRCGTTGGGKGPVPGSAGPGQLLSPAFSTHVCPERKVMTMQKIASTNRAVPVMEVGPPGSPCRRRSQTTAVSCPSRAGVGSDCGEGSQSAGQVGDEKTNVCEPLLTHRENSQWHRNRGLWVAPGQRRALRGEPSTRELPARGPGGARCIGGVSSSQALAWNRSDPCCNASFPGLIVAPPARTSRSALADLWSKGVWDRPARAARRKCETRVYGLRDFVGRCACWVVSVWFSRRPTPSRMRSRP